MELWLNMQRESYMQDISATIQNHLLLNFAARNRRSYYSRGRQVGSQTPETALRHVAQTVILEGYSNPCRSYGSIDHNIFL